jgi:CubicO group peptidase (beta-lactamase class C family)
MGASRMQAGFLIGVARARSLAAAVAASAVLWTASTMAQAPTNVVSLDGDLLPYLVRFQLPAVAAAVAKGGKILAAGAVGTRRLGTDTPVTINDRFHIGSDTKAMTSLLAGMLVEEGKLRWNTTVGEIYSELVGKMSKGVQDITLEQLLSHTSGIAGDSMEHVPLISYSVTDEAANLDGMRYTLVTRLLPLALHAQPGERFEYSNLGYTLAGAMMERVTGKTWEELVVARIFDPLKLSSAGFGPQSSLGRVDAPLGHAPDKDGKMQAFLAGPWGDNPLVIGPAGLAHMSVLDFATWAAWNSAQGRYGPPLAKPETIARLQAKVVDMPPKPDAPVGTPSSGGYGLGWGTVSLPFAPEPLVFHGGSNNMNLAYIVLQPKQELGLVTMTNISGPKANEALMAITEILYKRFSADQNRAPQKP